MSQEIKFYDYINQVNEEISKFILDNFFTPFNKEICLKEMQNKYHMNCAYHVFFDMKKLRFYFTFYEHPERELYFSELVVDDEGNYEVKAFRNTILYLGNSIKFYIKEIPEKVTYFFFFRCVEPAYEIKVFDKNQFIADFRDIINQMKEINPKIFI